MIACLSLRIRAAGGPVVAPVLLGVRTHVDGRPPEAVLPMDRAELRTYDHVVLLTHGYNTNEAYGLGSLIALARAVDPPGPNAITLVVLWPGDVDLGFASFLSYPFEERQADDTARRLASFLGTWMRPSATVHLVAHSLGCRVALGLATHLARRGRPVGHVGLMAAAVVAEGPSRPDAWRDGAAHAGQVAVLHSEDDEVLRFAFRSGNALAGWFGGGSRASHRRALGRVGPRDAPGQRTPDTVWGVQASPVGADGVDHGDYLPAPDPADRTGPQARATDWVRRLLAGEPRPPW